MLTGNIAMCSYSGSFVVMILGVKSGDPLNGSLWFIVDAIHNLAFINLLYISRASAETLVIFETTTLETFPKPH
jgi:hypothetical protein